MGRMQNGYEARMRRVLAYIDDHPGETLTLDRLSAVAAFSKFHFHRQFAAWTGMPAKAYVQAARVRLAAFRLAFRPDLPVSEIAFDCGYASPEAFARMFKQQTGQTPSDFRAQPGGLGWTRVTPGSERAPDHDGVEIADFAETRLALIEHDGPAGELGETIRRFIAWRRATGLRGGPVFNLIHGDADAAGRLRMGVGVATRRRVKANAVGVRAEVIPAGRYARLRLEGGDLRAAAAFLHGPWLRQSGAALRDAPLMAIRHALFPDVPESQAVTEVLLPIR